MRSLHLLFALTLGLAVAHPLAAQVRTPAPGTRQISVQFGLSSSHGNRDSYSLSSSVEWNENIGRFENDLDFDAHVTEAIGNNGGLSDEVTLDWTSRDALGSAPARRWFVLTHLAGDRQDYAGLEFRAIAGAGLGRHVVEATHLRVTLEGGVAAAWEKPEDGSTDVFPMPFAHGMMSWNLSKTANLNETLQLQLNADDTGDVRVSSETGVSIRITESISLRPSVKVSWDNRPAAGASSLDVTTHTSLAFDF
ncbi:MAG TPA: DUF481 domain-containing protein [Thermoanaerobaculia bacterium]|nr:DUF481 domain-containing protein [Thermoanaerobaculia bacterium]